MAGNIVFAMDYKVVFDPYQLIANRTQGVLGEAVIGGLRLGAYAPDRFNQGYLTYRTTLPTLFTEVVNRMEIVMDTVAVTSTNVNNTVTVSLFGLKLGGPTASNNTIVIQGQPVTMGANLVDTRLHFIVERVGTTNLFDVYLFSGKGHKLKVSGVPFKFEQFVEISKTNTAATYFYMPGMLCNCTSLVLAINTPIGTRLKDVQIEKAILEASNIDGFTSNDTGYVADTDKVELKPEPNISASVDGASITFGLKNPLPNKPHTHVYTVMSAASESVESVLHVETPSDKLVMIPSSNNVDTNVQGEYASPRLINGTVKLTLKQPTNGRVVSQWSMQGYPAMKGTIQPYSGFIPDQVGTAYWQPHVGTTQLYINTLDGGYEGISVPPGSQAPLRLAKRDYLTKCGFVPKGNWCLEFLCRSTPSLTTASAHITSIMDPAASGWSVSSVAVQARLVGTAHTLRVYLPVSVEFRLDVPLSVDDYTHYALSCKEGILTLYVKGKASGNLTIIDDPVVGARQTLCIGSGASTSQGTGYPNLKAMRMTVGSPVYDGDFTPPEDFPPVFE